jgi:hypothetical protein
MTVVTEDDVRTRNRAVVAQYMNTRGADPINRHLLFAEVCVGGLWITPDGESMTISVRRDGIPGSMGRRSPGERSPR